MMDNAEITLALPAYCTKELTISVPWGHISAKAWGDPCSKPVLVIHGLQDNAGSFDRLIPHLPSAFYYVCLDLPGHGLSSWFPQGIYLDVLIYVNALHRVVKHMKWKEFDCLAHSWGGRFAVYYAAIFPHEMTKLIIIDSASPVTMEDGEFLNMYRDTTCEMIQLEDKITNPNILPSYTYEQMVDKIIDKRPYPLSRIAALHLLLRAVKRNCNGGYYFSIDQRLKQQPLHPITKEQYFQIIKEIKIPFLCILTNFTYSVIKSNLYEDVGFKKGILAKQDVDCKAIKILQQNKNFKLVVVDGEHDIHNNEPQVIVPLVTKWLLNINSHM